MKAKFLCVSVLLHMAGQDKGETVELIPVYGDSEENKSFSKYTPSGKLTLTITNENLFGFYQPGKQYYLDVQPA
jgi:hypothetical protein